MRETAKQRIRRFSKTAGAGYGTGKAFAELNQHIPEKHTDGYLDAESGRIFITVWCACREYAELKIGGV